MKTKAERIKDIQKRLEDRKLKFPADMSLFDDPVTPRSLEEAASRAIISSVMAKCAFDLYDAEKPDEIKNEAKRELNRFGVSDLLFKEETKVLTKAYDENLCDTIGWRYEAARALLWALGIVGSIDNAKVLNVQEAIEDTYNTVTKFKSKEEFLAACRFRPDDELSDMFQTYWYYHWNLIDGAMFRRRVESINYDVVIERRRALQWLIYSDSDGSNSWNNISLDT